MTRLRRLDDADENLLLRWRGSEEVAEQMYTGASIDPDRHATWFRRVRRDEPAHRYRVLESDGSPCGLVYLTDIDQRSRRSCTWGGYVAPGAQGRGLGATMLRLSLPVAFEDLDLVRVWVEAFAENRRAIHVYERAGFRREAYLRSYVWKDGAARDVVGLALLREEWRELHAHGRSG